LGSLTGTRVSNEHWTDQIYLDRGKGLEVR